MKCPDCDGNNMTVSEYEDVYTCPDCGNSISGIILAQITDTRGEE